MQGRRTNIERILEYAHDCIPSIRLTSDLFRCQKKNRRIGIQANIAGTPNVPINARKIVRCGVKMSGMRSKLRYYRDPASGVWNALRMMIELNDKRRWRINRMSASSAHGNNGFTDPEGLTHVNIPVAFAILVFNCYVLRVTNYYCLPLWICKLSFSFNYDLYSRNNI